jgi:nicotinate-nucleotide adenylyltransferase
VRLGILGGTFDPVHVGHLVAASEARWALGLDRVLLVVANDPWQKTAEGSVTPAEDRFAVLAAAVEGVDGLEASRIEIDRGGPTYTIDTATALAARYPQAELFLIVGADVAATLDTWVRVEELIPLVTLLVTTRAGNAPYLPDRWRSRALEIPALDISSSDVRARVAGGRPVDFLVPPAAVRCIRARGLYAGGR